MNGPGTSHVEVCVVGAGPRGLSVLERLCANERATRSHASVTVHVVDAAPAGAGEVWRTEQSRHLLTNTVAAQITVFAEDDSRIDGPVEPGQSLYDWAVSLSLLGGPGACDEKILAEAQGIGPNSYPSRALYGCYLQDVFRRVVSDAPEHVTVRVHTSRAVAIADTHGVVGGPQGIRLANGTRLNHLDAVVLAQGQVPARLSPREARTASLARIHHLTYLTPANPAEVELFKIQADRPVLLRGLGLNFFDYMALFTAGRGGTYVREGEALVYRPSGREPRMVASSRRGVPYPARGEGEKGAFGRHEARVLTPSVFAALRERVGTEAPAVFTADVWPLVAREVECVYYRTLLDATGRGDEFADRYAALPAGADPAPLLDSYGVEPGERWDWQRLATPHLDRTFTDRTEFRTWLLAHLAQDVRRARAGNDPLTAALDVLRDLRDELRLKADHLNTFLAAGPPVSRVEEMVALIEAGLLEVTGPGTVFRIDVDAPAFVAESTLVPGPPARTCTLIEARLPEPDLRRTDDPLLRHMLDTDQCSPYRIPDAHETNYETGGLAVTARPFHVVDAGGETHPRRFAYGVPTELASAGLRPGVDSVTLGDSDAIARAVLTLPAVAHVPADVRRHAIEAAEVVV